jgi:hypothetical protein
MKLIEFSEKPTARKDEVCYRAKRTSLMWPQHLAFLVFLVSTEIWQHECDIAFGNALAHVNFNCLEHVAERVGRMCPGLILLGVRESKTNSSKAFKPLQSLSRK